jgi:hypothetical protein
MISFRTCTSELAAASNGFVGVCLHNLPNSSQRQQGCLVLGLQQVRGAPCNDKNWCVAKIGSTSHAYHHWQWPCFVAQCGRHGLHASVLTLHPVPLRKMRSLMSFPLFDTELERCTGERVIKIEQKTKTSKKSKVCLKASNWARNSLRTLPNGREGPHICTVAYIQYHAVIVFVS